MHPAMVAHHRGSGTGWSPSMWTGALKADDCLIIRIPDDCVASTLQFHATWGMARLGSRRRTCQAAILLRVGARSR
jgi:hypothetical protein